MTATLEGFNSLMSMRRRVITTTSAIFTLALLLAALASAAHGHRQVPVKCAPSSHTLLADAQAQVYAAREGSLKYLSIRGCAFGQRRSFIVAACNNEESATICASKSHVTLAGAVVASEDVFTPECRCADEKSIDEWHVEVRNLRTGRVLHKVPTGAPLKPEPRYVGVGPIVGLVLKSDGSVAWIAEDYERSSTPHDIEAQLFFDVYVTDKTGTRLLASGTSIDPSSLALSVGGFGVSGVRRTIVGSTLYWNQGGKPVSATLN
jgi:hypothetical protein